MLKLDLTAVDVGRAELLAENERFLILMMTTTTFVPTESGEPSVSGYFLNRKVTDFALIWVTPSSYR